MASGGARANSGPPPDPNALRRDRKDDGEWLSLPASGRQGDAPEWPLSDVSEREWVLWEAQWRRPQAIVWEQNGQELEVALFVRSVADCERPEGAVTARNLVKQQMEALGLSVPGMNRNRWRIVADEEKKPKRRSQSSARDRLKVVNGGDTA